VTAAALKLGWTPVGDGMCEKARGASTPSASCSTARDGDRWCGASRSKVRELPGLEWFDMFTKYVNEHDIRRAPDTWFPNRRERTRHARAETVST
jgi:hypothetical protein